MNQTGYAIQEGDHSEFIDFLFGRAIRPPGTIVLESPPVDPHTHRGLHIFQQLLMIFVDGLQYLYGDSQGKVDVNRLTEADLDRMQGYFRSMNYELVVDRYETIQEYIFRFPDYLKHPETLHEDIGLTPFFYDIYGDRNRVFRITFRDSAHR